MQCPVVDRGDAFALQAEVRTNLRKSSFLNGALIQYVLTLRIQRADGMYQHIIFKQVDEEAAMVEDILIIDRGCNQFIERLIRITFPLFFPAIIVD